MTQPEITLEDLHRIYVVVPRDDGHGTENVTVAQMSDRQFREWIVAKGALHGVPIVAPIGRIGFETRVRMLNYLIRHGVRIYMVPKAPPEA
ncbi:hypothetical protein [Thermorudis peleae]|uniref:hypothetical protein n=1 Tax=Thermorudis peleae TaxID=1382356 RepID=UPI000571293D|nr:hypothetical protein [Thermorudis peleae]MBX6753644.1 hypothetical protein [Thermorudis peleae]